MTFLAAAALFLTVASLLVVGATGFVGSHVVPATADAHEPTRLTRTTSSPWRLGPVKCGCRTFACAGLVEFQPMYTSGEVAGGQRDAVRRHSQRA